MFGEKIIQALFSLQWLTNKKPVHRFDFTSHTTPSRDKRSAPMAHCGLLECYGRGAMTDVGTSEKLWPRLSLDFHMLQEAEFQEKFATNTQRKL